MTIMVTGGEVLLLHLVCEQCHELSPGYPNDEAKQLHAHPARFHAMADGWVERLEGARFFYVCSACVRSEKVQGRQDNRMGFGDVFKQPIKVKLDEKQKAERKDRLVAVEQEIDRVKSDKRGAVVTFNDELKEYNKERKELLVAITTGVEEIEAEVIQRIDERRGEVLTVRCDTQEILKDLTRPLTADERQLKLDDAMNGKPKKKRGRKAKADEAEAAG